MTEVQIIILLVSNLIFLLIGYFLRDLRKKSIVRKAKQVITGVRDKVVLNKSEVLDWEKPETKDEIAEEKARERMKHG